jgi:hypothetical protein
VQSGEWIQYSIAVAATGMYGLNYQLAGPAPSAQTVALHTVFDSADCKQVSAYVHIIYLCMLYYAMCDLPAVRLSAKA